MLQSKQALWNLVLLYCYLSCLSLDATSTLGLETDITTSQPKVTELTVFPTAGIVNTLETQTVNNFSDVVTESTSGASTSHTGTSENSSSSQSENLTPSSPNNHLEFASDNGTNTNVNTPTTIQPETTTYDVLKDWLHFENLTKIFAKNAVKSLLPGLMEGANNLNISDSCRRDGLKFIVGLRDIKTWAFSFIDASGKFIDGMLSGTMASLGDYDQCLDIKATNDKRGKNFGQVMFTGKYCALDIKPPLPAKRKFYKLNEPLEELKEFSQGGNIINEAAKAAQFFHFLSMRFGLCVPSGCQASDIQQVIDPIAHNTRWSATVNRCEVKEENNYTGLIIAVMTVMCFFGFMLLIGSLVDLYHIYAEKKVNNVALELLVCFSLVTNFQKFVNTESSSGNMACLHGIRFLSISWVILAHTYLNTNYVISKGLRKATTFQTDFFFQAIVNASVAVDTFFFIGGLLVCYSTVKVVKENKKKFNIFLYILHRLFRLLPVYIMVIAFACLSPILGSGPVFHDTLDGFLDACYKNWWTNILFVNNFVNTDQICLPQSWYVACDMQLYILALIVLLPILRWPWVGVSIAFLGTLASILGTMAMTYYYEYPPTMLFVHPDIEQRIAYWANAYFKPYSHAAPYCIGLITGYVLATRPKLKFPLVVRVIGWSTAIACNMAVLYGVYEWNKGRDPELVETLSYSSLHRTAWAFGIAWMVVNCATGQGGVVNYILSWKAWIPLGRLTYALYLIHPIVQIAAVANVRMRAMIVHYFIVWIFFGHLLITVGSSFCASMLVEAPFIAIEKIVLRAITGTPTRSTDSHAAIRSESTEPKRIDAGENKTIEETRETNNSNGIAKRELISNL